MRIRPILAAACLLALPVPAAADAFGSIGDAGISMGQATNRQVLNNLAVPRRGATPARPAPSRGAVVQSNANLPRWQGVRMFDTRDRTGRPVRMACTSDDRGLICQRAR